MRVLARLAVPALAATAVVLWPTASVASTPATFSTPTAAQTAGLTAAEKALLASGQPEVIVLDPITGDILSVSAASIAAVAPSIARHSVCNPGNGCYLTNRVPYADEGFYGGAGTSYGSWPYRSAYTSGKWRVSACWTTHCGPVIPPGSKVTFTSDVTGTSFTIY